MSGWTKERHEAVKDWAANYTGIAAANLRDTIAEIERLREIIVALRTDASAYTRENKIGVWDDL